MEQQQPFGSNTYATDAADAVRTLTRNLVLERFGTHQDSLPSKTDAAVDHATTDAGRDGRVRPPRRKYRGWALASRRSR